jgi:polyphosphate kinase 2
MGKRQRNGRDDGDDTLSKDDYEAALEPMQLELIRVARWLQHTGQRVLLLLEGRDTAGKTGVINTLLKGLNPRQCNVVALGKPDEVTQTQWYFQRYVAHLPAAGQITLFDRSWYNRAGVERVMGFASEEQVKAFLRQVPVFERLLVDDGIRLFKYWLTVDQAEQERRFAERRDDPLKRWKLSPIDLQARLQYQAYGEARDAMLKASHTDEAPWTLVDFNDQRRGRLALIRDLLDRLPDKDVPDSAIELPPLPGKPAEESLPKGFKPLTWRDD